MSSASRKTKASSVRTHRAVRVRNKVLERAIKTGVLRVGQEVYMQYGPTDKRKHRFVAFVRRNGLEVDGSVYSPSYAAVVCMRKTGSRRETANGWRSWKTADGVSIGALLRRS